MNKNIHLRLEPEPVTFEPGDAVLDLMTYSPEKKKFVLRRKSVKSTVKRVLSSGDIVITLDRTGKDLRLRKANQLHHSVEGHNKKVVATLTRLGIDRHRVVEVHTVATRRRTPSSPRLLDPVKGNPDCNEMDAGDGCLPMFGLGSKRWKDEIDKLNELEGNTEGPRSLPQILRDYD